MKNTNNIKESEMTTSESKTTTIIILDLINKNMKAGSTYKEARKQAYNRLNLEYPKVLNSYIDSNRINFKILY